MTMQRRVSALLVLVGALTFTSACNPGEKKVEETKVSAIPVETLVVSQRPFVDRVDVSGVARPMHEVRVAAEAPGRVLSAPFEEGEKIGKGKLLLRVDSTIDSARIDLLKSQVSQATREYERTKLLANQGLATPQQLDQAASSVDTAQLNLKQARVTQGKTTVRSPISGFVATKSAEQGEYVNPGQPLAHIVDYETIKIEASVPESDVRYVVEGREVDIYLPALEKTVKGTVNRRAIVASDRTRTFPVEIHVPNPELEILPGMQARVIVPRKDYGMAVVVPRDAILEGFENREAMVVPAGSDEGKAEVRIVELGPAQGRMVLVKKGLSAGDRLIVKGHRGIADGTRVKVVRESTASSDAEATRETASEAHAADGGESKLAERSGN